MTEHTGTEQWRPIPDWEGLYEASDHGRVRSVDRIVTRSDGQSLRCPGVVLQPFLRDDGHRTVTLTRPGKKQTRWVYQLVMLAFVGPPPPGMEVCHWDGNGSNDALPNLRYDTRLSNIRDQIRHGTHRNGCRTRCPRGHLLVSPNLVPADVQEGHRSCLACSRAQSSAWHAKWSGRPYDFAESTIEHYARIMHPTVASNRQLKADTASKPTCKVPNCEIVSDTRGWCKSHYNRWYRTGDVNSPVRKTTDICTIIDCEREHVARGWCRKHYDQQKRRGRSTGRQTGPSGPQIEPAPRALP